MKDKRLFRLYCFSPAVMLATFTVEFILAAVVASRYAFDTVGKITTAVLILLGTFQLAEYSICVTNGQLGWALIGYTAITMLPPLGVHLAAHISGRGHRIAQFSYALSIAWVGLFWMKHSVITHVACTGNYAILTLQEGYGLAYGYYYFGLLFLGLGLCAYGLRSRLNIARSRALLWLAASYALIIVPTYLVNVAWSQTLRGVPSVMCGFAVMFALILSLKIMPLVGTRRPPAGEPSRVAG